MHDVSGVFEDAETYDHSLCPLGTFNLTFLDIYSTLSQTHNLHSAQNKLYLIKD